MVNMAYRTISLRLESWTKDLIDSSLQPLIIITLLLGLATLYGAFLYAPADAIQGDVQRIFYIHVPMAMDAYLAGGMVAAMGVVYLKTRRMIWDVIARCSAE